LPHDHELDEQLVTFLQLGVAVTPSHDDPLDVASEVLAMADEVIVPVLLSAFVDRSTLTLTDQGVAVQELRDAVGDSLRTG
jgi:hypothetical protein